MIRKSKPMPEQSMRHVAAAAWSDSAGQYEGDDDPYVDEFDMGAEIDGVAQMDTEENAYLARLHTALDD